MLLKNLNLPCGTSVDIKLENDRIIDVSSLIEGDADYDFNNEYFVSPGWIDAHSHAFNSYEFIGAVIDDIGVKNGVTTLIDAGTIGANDIDLFRKEVESSLTDVYTLMNISKIGIIAQNELEDLNNVDIDLFVKTYNENKDLIKGLKARMSGSVVVNNGIKPLHLAKEIQNKTDLPLMVHIGNPDPNLDDILKIMGHNDILTHCFHGKKSNIFNNSSNTFDLLKLSIAKGMVLDIGHGTSSFSFETCKHAFDEGIKADLFGTDIYRKNRVDGPVYNMQTTISKMLYCGYTHEEIITAITKTAANVFKLNDRGDLGINQKADLTIYKIEDKTLDVKDSEGIEVKLNKYFNVYSVVKNGTMMELNNDN